MSTLSFDPDLLIVEDDVRVLLVSDIETLSVSDDYPVPIISFLQIFLIQTIFNSKHFPCIFIIFSTSNFLPYFNIFLQNIFLSTYYFSQTMTFGIHLFTVIIFRCFIYFSHSTCFL